MLSYRFGDVVPVDFPFADRTAEKRRPGLVLAQDSHGDLLVARITSKRVELPTDVTRVDWKFAGLNIPSNARLLKLATTHESYVLKRLGKVSGRDRQAAINALRKFLDSVEAEI
ncbi:MAG TPA: type II toxin-antitoxin system PemK/MazF family toxin [Candidatus Kapabacteria bacterium]|nr:type II toxin-antitoxin system PemK/MazF family toxin [Candidatus Kapabacteria bacterium]